MAEELLSKVHSIRELSFSCQNPVFKEGESVNEDLLKFDYNFDYGLNVPDNLIAVILRVSVSYDETSTPLLFLELLIEYSVKEMSGVLLSNEDKTASQIPLHFIRDFVYESMVIAKGYVAAKSLGMWINQFPLPSYDPVELLEVVRERYGSNELENDQEEKN